MCRAAIVTLGLMCALVASAPAQERPASPQPDPQGLISEPLVIERAALFAGRNLGGGEGSAGFYADFMNMIPGAGWLAVGPGYRQWYFGESLLLDGSAA